MTQAYLDTRVSILAARLVSPDALLDLIGDRAAIDGTPEPAGGEAEPEERSTALIRNVLSDFEVVVRGAGGSGRELLLHLTRWFELANVKALIRGRITGLTGESMREYLLPLGKFSTLPAEALLRVDDPAELLRRLESTPYADVARQARRTLEEGGDLAAVDATIDRLYLVGLRKRAAGVPRAERPAVGAIAGLILDWSAVVWLLRYRFAYALSPAETWYQLVPSELWLTGDRLKELVQLDTPQRVLAALPPAIARRLDGAATVVEAESRLERHTWQACDAALLRRGAPLARAFAYLVRRWLELRRISAILKGRRLGFSPELVRFAAHLEA